MASAHGAAATNTTSARSIQTSGLPKTLPVPAISAAAIMMLGTNGRAIQSASR
ncbi:Uncharacterised protein [Mycobacterium tuberculosis]|nr:Uncharacterised protein [Mycobacterium tuberculosis]CNY50320.1 Uncharacterised protein [Mycobacterium tuberculosis]SGO18413.1 Uncharacterised protein [Mycobacterium tuberculosis]